LKPDRRYLEKPLSFWAAVRLISEQIGYEHGELSVGSVTECLQTVEASLAVKAVEALPKTCRIDVRGNKQWIVHHGPVDAKTRDDLVGLDPKLRTGWSKAVNALFERSRKRPWVLTNLLLHDDRETPLGALVCDYLNYRQGCLSGIENVLMNKEKAKSKFEEVRAQLGSTLKVPTNKQTGEKAGPAYFTGIVHMLIDAQIEGLPCDYDPQSLTTFLRGGEPVRTLSRRMDGAFPSTVDPIVVWEIKEYYNTTTFGSRVAGAVYETMLDGMEVKELSDSEHIACRHYVIVDGWSTWWEKGRSYLCRFVDTLHMGYVDEVLFGTEVLDRVPELAKEWAQEYRARLKTRT